MSNSSGPGRRAARDLRVPQLEPIAPSEPVEGGANEKYFGQWQDLKRDLRMRAYLDLVSLWYERRVRRYGYSLLSPGRRSTSAGP